MIRRAAPILLASLLQSAAPGGSAARADTQGSATPCRMDSASVWIRTWLEAWELTSREILRLEPAAAPEMVFFDTTCTYTTSPVTAGGAAPQPGPPLHGAPLPWRALPHGGTITLPDSGEVQPQLMSFANFAKSSGPYFVMSAPAIWRARVAAMESHGFTAVFLHEFAHTMQVRGMARIIGPIDDTWPYPEELDDDAVQTHFESDSEYVAAYLQERDVMYAAADAASDDAARELAARALGMMRARHAHWFTAERAVFATLDDIWLSMEGAGQFAGYAWLAHPRGGGLTREEAIAKMLGRRRRWSQDQGLALMLVLDRLLPEWPKSVFADPSAGALELLERATGEPHGVLKEKAAAAASAAPDSAALRAMLDAFLAGAGGSDPAVHDRFWADDLIYTGSSGRRVGKADIMRDLRAAPPPQPTDPQPVYSAEDVRIQQYGPVAIVAFRLVATTPSDNGPVVATYLNTSTFLKRDGAWRVVAWQATKVPEPEDAAPDASGGQEKR